MDDEQYNESWWNDAAGHAWESWYAWHPVRVKGRWCWFKTVYRKYNWAKSTEQPFGREYDYGDIFDVLSSNQSKPTPVRVDASPPFKGLQDG
jgi:hypothetical protein